MNIHLSIEHRDIEHLAKVITLYRFYTRTISEGKLQPEEAPGRFQLQAHIINYNLLLIQLAGKKQTIAKKPTTKHRLAIALNHLASLEYARVAYTPQFVNGPREIIAINQLLEKAWKTYSETQLSAF